MCVATESVTEECHGGASFGAVCINKDDGLCKTQSYILHLPRCSVAVLDHVEKRDDMARRAGEIRRSCTQTTSDEEELEKGFGKCYKSVYFSIYTIDSRRPQDKRQSYDPRLP